VYLKRRQVLELTVVDRTFLIVRQREQMHSQVLVRKTRPFVKWII